MPKPDKEPTLPADATKRQALIDVIEALEPLDVTTRREVLRAAASYHGIQLGTEIAGR